MLSRVEITRLADEKDEDFWFRGRSKIDVFPCGIGNIVECSEPYLHLESGLIGWHNEIFKFEDGKMKMEH